jgi:hypothetical protein
VYRFDYFLNLLEYIRNIHKLDAQKSSVKKWRIQIAQLHWVEKSSTEGNYEY